MPAMKPLTTDRIYQLVDQLRAATQAAAAAEVTVQQLTAAQANSDQAWAEVRRLRHELFDTIHADATGVDLAEYLAEQNRLRGR